jgi:hypothetical protein
MKKIVLSLTTLLLGSIMNVNAQCSVKLNADKLKICSDENATLSTLSSDIQSIPDFSDSKNVFNVSDLKLDPTIISLIQSGVLNNVSYPFAQTSGNFNLSLNGYQLKNTVISSGTIDVSIVTDLKQDLKLIFELPYFKINGKSIKDSILIDGKNAGTGTKTFTKSFNLKDAVVDFSAGDPNKYNIVSYIVKPSIKISTTTFTAKETGDLKIDLKGLTFVQNITYKWFKDGERLYDADGPTIKSNASGKYLVETTSNCGVSKDSINLVVVQKPLNNVTTTGNLVFCEGDSVRLAAEGQGSYKWSDNATDQIVFIKKSGTYTVTVTNDICVSTSDAIQVTVNPNPDVKLNHKDTTIIVGSEFNLKATGGTSYEWNDKSTNDNIIVKDAGTYSVTGKNDAGCITTATIKVEVREKGAGLTNLNNVNVAVSPNPSTDVLHISINEFKNKTVSIVDLKGNLIFNQSLNAVNTTIAVDSFAKGMYVLTILDASNSVVNSQRIVVE